MSRKYKFHDNDKLYFISFATVHWIDVFVREEYNQIVIESWKHCQEKEVLEIYGWCLMPSHIYIIIGSKNSELKDIVRDMKKHTSLELKSAIKNNVSESRKEWIIWMCERVGKKNGNNQNRQFWQQGVGFVADVIGVILPVVDMYKKGINGDNFTDFAAGSAAFVPGGGWLIAPLLWIQKKTDQFFPQKTFDKMHEFRDTPIHSNNSNGQSKVDKL